MEIYSQAHIGHAFEMSSEQQPNHSIRRLGALRGISSSGFLPRFCVVASSREVLTRKNDDFNDLPKGMAIMSLGELGDVKSVPILVKILKNLRVGKWKPQKQSPLRGYAALA